jgi:biofilm protein TabA
MIATDLAHLGEQIALTPSIRKAIEFLRKARGQELADGRVEIDGDTVYALVQSYETIAGSEAVFEAHRRYVDIQYIVSGDELIGWALLERLSVTTPYDEGKDICFGSVPPGDITRVRLGAGQLAVLYPTDAHAPKLAVQKTVPVKKIVVKVAVQTAVTRSMSF